MPKPLFGWRAAIASENGPESTTTRHILLTLSLHMGERGNSCFPSLETLSTESGYSKSTVSKHINRALDEGWLTRQRQKRANGGDTSSRYRPQVPEGYEHDEGQSFEHDAKYPPFHQASEVEGGVREMNTGGSRNEHPRVRETNTNVNTTRDNTTRDCSDLAGSGGTPPEFDGNSDAGEEAGASDEGAQTEALTSTAPPTQHMQPPSEAAIRDYVSAPDSLGDQNWRAAVIFTDLFDPGGDPGDHISRLIREANRMLGGETPSGKPIDKPESRVQVALAASLLYESRPDLRNRETKGGRIDQPKAALNVISRKISEELESDESSGIEVDEDNPFANLHDEKVAS